MRKKISNSLMIGYILCVLLGVSACNSSLDVQKAYEFDIQTMPVRKEIKQNETAEIRCTLTEKGSFADNRYTIRYFQSVGFGELRLGKNGEVFLPNDRYPLPDKEFRLYYTSRSNESQTFEVVVEDGFGNQRRLEFEFSAQREEIRE